MASIINLVDGQAPTIVVLSDDEITALAAGGRIAIPDLGAPGRLVLVSAAGYRNADGPVEENPPRDPA